MQYCTFLLRDLRCLSDSPILFCMKEDAVMRRKESRERHQNGCSKISYNVCGTWKNGGKK